ncbi:MAG TPA: hypothetical protein VFD13_04745, partial [Candidatus Kapabacteria bacterium]|nr:hypothetical protein [Candidatus Kapabacteria bacterium]
MDNQNQSFDIDEIVLESNEVPILRTRHLPLATRTPRKPLSWKTERAYWKRGIYSIIGVDEAGRGPLAGPVVAAAVFFDYDKCRNFPKSLRDLNDS